MPTINNLPPLTEATGTIAFPVVDYNTDPDTTRKATFQQFRDYLEATAAVQSVAGRIGEVTLDYTDINGLDSIAHTGLYTATSSVLGGVKIGSGINKIGDGTISVTPYTLNTATASTLGGVKIGTNLSITGDGTLNASTASNYTLSTATISALGGVKVGSGISVTSDGTISTVPLTTATTSTLGGVIVGAGIDVDANGVISISTASANFTNNILKINVGEISDHVSGSVQTAPNTAAFQIDRGSALAASINYTDARYFNDNNGEITRGIFFFRSSGTYAMIAVKGLRVNTGQAELNIFGSENANSVISVKGTTNYESNVIHDDHIPNKKYVDDSAATTATNSILGNVKIGSGITAIDDGTISVTPYTLSTATSTVLGGVKIGSGITAIDDGTISVTPYTLNTATASVLGGVKVGSGLASYGDGTIYVTGGGGGGGASIISQDEGSTLSTQTSSINFIGAGVTATNIADAITIRIEGGGGGFGGGIVQNTTQFIDATPTASSATGAVSVVGGVGIGGGIFVSGVGAFKNASATSSSSTGALQVVGGVGIGGSLFVNNSVTATNVRVTSYTNATSTLTGALTVAGGVGVNGSIYVANTVTAASFVNAGAGTPTIQSPTSIVLDAQTEVNVLGSPFRLWSRTVSQLNALGGVTAGAMAYCSDESGGAVPVFYDGTNWRRVTDRNIIS